MIKYEGQLKEKTRADFNVYIKRQRKEGKTPAVYYCDDIFTFDIETTSAYIKDDGSVIGYEPGHSAEYWNSLEPVSLCYIWQFSVNDTVYYGRELRDFLEVLEDLNALKMKVVVWIHNAGFEFAFLDNILKFKSVFARTAHKVMKFTAEGFDFIEFRCSYMLTRLSLAAWGKTLGVEKLVGALNYEAIRTPLTKLTLLEEAYAERDCIVTYTGILRELKEFKHIHDIPLTQTGKVRRELKKRVTADAGYMRQMKRLIPKDVKEYRRLRLIFSGGYTHANRYYSGDVIDEETYGKIHHGDIASSYPAVMLAYKMPYTPWVKKDNILPDKKDFEDTAYLLKIRFTNIECQTHNTYIQASKCRGKNIWYDNGRVISADELTLFMTEYDWQIIEATYTWEDMEVLSVHAAKKRYLPTLVTKFILELYGNKTSLKNVTDDEMPGAEDLYRKSKEMINALFGLMVTAVYMADCKYDQEGGDWSIDDIDEEALNDYLDRLRFWKDKRYFVSYSVGLYITSIARFRLWQLIRHTDPDMIYCDTDSIFYIGEYDFEWFNKDIEERLRKACKVGKLDFELTRPKDRHGIPRPLGILESEPDCIEFTTLGAKKYCERREDKNLYLTVSGINKDAVWLLDNDIRNFRDGFDFDKDGRIYNNEGKVEKENPEAVSKRLLTYCTDQPDVIYPDGYKSTYKRGINLRRTGYKIHLTDEYKELLEASNYDLSDLPDATKNYIRGII